MSEAANRRPLKSRSSGWARALAAALARTAITPNEISVASVVFACGGAAALIGSGAPWALLTCAACVQLRLVCNLLDGMVAVEGGKGSPVGGLYNEIPDRIADAALLVAAGYAVRVPWLGWCAALLAVATAYLRALGSALGLPQDFRGPMAKQQRMAVLTLACVLGAAEAPMWHSDYALRVGLGVIAAGALLTCLTRTRALARALGTRVRP
ncbi:MAG TPA: CDP-alcohol phosphatidyltransferase family protein [Steroidobacteraceae bacterium]|nr:CDP-alcohol phosphatidyltransferase family protein [Steroidobacteraceae bacterium]